MDGDSILAKAPWLRWLVHGLGGGTAVVIGLAAIDAVRDRPEFLPQLLGGNVLFFFVVVAGMFVFDRRLQGFTELQTRHVAAQEQLAAGVQALVTKDDERAREQEILLDHLAIQMDKVVGYLERERAK